MIHLRELQPGTRFKLLRTGNKYLYLGRQPSKHSGLMIHACQREWGDQGITSLHHSCHVKPVVRIPNE
jgi:hypothetical protein